MRTRKRSPRIIPLAMLAAILAYSCRSAAPPSAPAPQPGVPVRTTEAPASLPPVPMADGPLKITVVYPQPGQQIESRDSNFILGNLGTGRATLSIDGVPVRVLPNGSFLAFLALPPATSVQGASLIGQYVLSARAGNDSAAAQLPVKLMPAAPVLSDTGKLVVDASSITPAATLTLRDSEPVRVSVRAPHNASAWVAWRGGRQALVSLEEEAAAAGAGRRFIGDRNAFVGTVSGGNMAKDAELFVARGRDTLHFTFPDIRTIDSAGAAYPVVMIGADSSTVSDTDRLLIGRATPGGTYKWFFLPGTLLQLTGRQGNAARVRLDGRLEIWTEAGNVVTLPEGAPLPDRVTSDAKLIASADGRSTDLSIPVSGRPAYYVEEDGRDVTLTLYDTRSNTDRINFAAADKVVENVTWVQAARDRLQFHITLREPSFGYQAVWDNGRFVLRLRRAPRVDPAHPLQGLVIAVDPGHPPIGATGPTGLWEPVPNLAIAQHVQKMLADRGVTVIMTRVDSLPVSLQDRTTMARRANADALVSIHQNALPDGINPFVNNGSGTYFYQPHSEPLARALEARLVRHTGMRDLGINYANLHLARPTWMPAVLCEGSFIMIPEQEAALRTEQFQTAYARGVVEGLEDFFREIGRAQGRAGESESR